MDTYVRSGELDLVLLRPVRSGWFAAVRWMAPAELAGVAPGVGVLLAGLALAGVRPGWADVGAALGWQLVGTVGFALVWINLSYAAFWMDGTQPVTGLVRAVRSVGSFPSSYLQPPARWVFATVVPASLLGAVPAEALLGTSRWLTLALAFAGVGLLPAVTIGHWRVAVRRYSGAST